MKTILLVAGGTGGHIFPAQAVATELVHQGYKVVFVTDNAGKRLDSLPASVQVMSLPLARRRNTIKGMVKFAWGLASSLYHSWRGLKAMRPSAVIGFGGYPSFPPLLAALHLKIPTIIHEQNAVMGQVNRCLSPKTTAVATSFEQTQAVPNTVLPVTTGNPVRSDFQMLANVSYAVPGNLEPIKILITGGSQGASIFSKVMPESFARLSKELKERLVVTHQCPEKDIKGLRLAYASAGLTDVKVTSFIPTMAEEMITAHLVIARSGASTLGEIAMLGRPAILVPFQYAKDNHQYYNAQVFNKVGAGWLVEEPHFTASHVAEKLMDLLSNLEKLTIAAKNAKLLAAPNAVENIVNLIKMTVKD